MVVIVVKSYPGLMVIGVFTVVGKFVSRKWKEPSSWTSDSKLGLLMEESEWQPSW